MEQRAEVAGYADDHLARITPHSLRAGCITQLARARVHERDIMKHSRHGSATVMRGYIRAAYTELEATSAALWEREEFGRPFGPSPHTILANALLVQDSLSEPSVDLVNWTSCVVSDSLRRSRVAPTQALRSHP